MGGTYYDGFIHNRTSTSPEQPKTRQTLMTHFLTISDRNLICEWLLDCLLEMDYDDEQADQIVYHLKSLNNDDFITESKSWMPEVMSDLSRYYEVLNCT
jgi:hypothetical protein